MKISLSLLLAALSLSACGQNHEPASNSDLSFGAGEHVWLGNAAFKKVMAEAPVADVPTTIRRADGKFEYTYGELVALGGDFYRTPDELDKDTKTQSWKTPFANNIKVAREIFSGELDAIQKQFNDGKVDYPDNNIPYLAAFPSTYLSISENNVDHFGWHSAKAYVKYHQAALDLASQANQSNGSEKAELLRRALLSNAFADHFLSDGFASGHIRMPRNQSLEWGKKNKITSKAIGGLSKLLHDEDHSYAETKGLLVVNARGDEWRTRSDGELAIASKDSDSNITLPREAIEISLKEVFQAYSNNVKPASTFKAMELMPWVSPKETSLVDSFPADMPGDKLNPMLSRLGVIWKLGVLYGLNEGTARRYLRELPGLMEQFRSDVSRDAEDAGLKVVVPGALIEGYKNVH